MKFCYLNISKENNMLDLFKAWWGLNGYRKVKMWEANNQCIKHTVKGNIKICIW